MSYNKNSIFYKEFSEGNIDYRLEFTPAEDSVLTSPTYVEFPNFSLITSNFGTVADYDGNIAIGIHNSIEISFEVIGDAFTGDWQAVYEWIVAGGVSVVSEYITNISNKWVLYKKVSGSYTMIYTGFQLTNGAGAVYKFNTTGNILTYEVKVQDAMRAVLSDIPLTADMASYSVDTYLPDLIVHHEVTSNDGKQMWVLDETFSPTGTIPLPDYPGRFKSIKYIYLIRNFAGAIITAMYMKFRVNQTVPYAYFDGDFLDGYYFYGINSTYNDIDTRGAVIPTADLRLVAQKKNAEGVFDWNIMIDGILAKGNMYDLLRFLAENFCKKVVLDYNTTWGFPKLSILHLEEFQKEYTFTTSNVLNEFEVAQSQDVSAIQQFHFSNIGGTDINNTKLVGNATLLRQDSYEIDSIIDNYKCNITAEKDDLVFFESGQVTIGADTSHLNCFFTLESIDDYYILKAVNNSVTYRGTDYGALAKNPLIVDRKWGYGDLKLLQEYLTATQNFDRGNPYASGNGIGAVFVDVLSTFYGVSANPHTATIKVNADDFDMSMFGAKIHFNYSNFVGGLPDFDLSMPTSGFLVGIESFDITTNTYTCTIILNI